MDNVEKYIEKYNDIENNLSTNTKNSNNILTDLKDELSDINDNKYLVNKSKSLMIKINKSNNIINNKKNIENHLNEKIKSIDNIDLNLIKSIISKYKIYLNLDYDILNSKIEKFIEKNNKFKYLNFYSVINFKKKSKNNLQKLISSINTDKSFIDNPKIIFMDYINLLESYDSISKYIYKFNYKYSSLSKKILKRGFMFEVSKKNKKYILKYQPNKSFMEILVNKYLSKYNYLSEYILFPEYFFINRNNSYFYIIQKYDYDLFTYIKLKKNFLDTNEIIYIIQFLITTIFHLHNLNIIYADIKLENFIVNVIDNKINDIKLIDFDVSLFENLPKEFTNFDPKIIKLLENKKPRGTKFYQSSNNSMEKSNDIYSIGTFIIILLYKNTLKMLHKSNYENISENLLSKIFYKLTSYKNKLEDDIYKKKLMKYIFRIYNDRRFKLHWGHKIKIKNIYFMVKKCIDQEINITELYNEIVLI